MTVSGPTAWGFDMMLTPHHKKKTHTHYVMKY